MARHKRNPYPIVLTIVLLIHLAIGTPAFAQPTGTLNVATYNVESPRFCTPDRPSGKPSETRPSTVAKHFEDLAGPAIWALAEVPDEDTAKIYRDAAAYPGSDFDLLMGTLGGCFDYLAILYDSDRLTLLEDRQLIAEVGGDPPPLAARFQDNSDGTEFWAVANHFARSNERTRNAQARNLRAWVERRDLPVVVMGDTNMDYSVDITFAFTRPQNCPGEIVEGNRAFELFTASDDVNWIKPACLLDNPNTCPPRGYGLLRKVLQQHPRFRLRRRSRRQ